MTTPTARPAPWALALAVAATTALAWPLAAATAAHAVPAEDPPGIAEAGTPPVAIDPKDPDLKMVDGATLAPGKVLNIKSIVESDGGEERREDTNANVTFALQAEVLFDMDSAKLGPEAKARIETIAAEITRQNADRVRVFGFTDNLGSASHGDDLSKARANAVQQELSRKLGASITYEVRGYGEQYPIADNATEEGRKKNRRVEVTFPRPAAAASPPSQRAGGR
ncbi:OmpA family protein [Streptomyces sp. URMC 123]|uniref:OmpA family protein n=1 Tax=Streptomyces sp. URMC 123 TaxID=3423403 RepID=UPI003F1B01D8